MRKLIFPFLIMFLVLGWSAFLFAAEGDTPPPQPTPDQVADNVKDGVDQLLDMFYAMQRENRSLQTQLDAEKQKTADLQTRMQALEEQANAINEQLQTVKQENANLGQEITRLSNVDDENAKLRAALEQVYKWLKGEQELIDLLEGILNE